MRHINVSGGEWIQRSPPFALLRGALPQLFGSTPRYPAATGGAESPCLVLGQVRPLGWFLQTLATCRLQLLRAVCVITAVAAFPHLPWPHRRPRPSAMTLDALANCRAAKLLGGALPGWLPAPSGLSWLPPDPSCREVVAGEKPWHLGGGGRGLGLGGPSRASLKASQNCSFLVDPQMWEGMLAGSAGKGEAGGARHLCSLNPPPHACLSAAASGNSKPDHRFYLPNKQSTDGTCLSGKAAVVFVSPPPPCPCV